MDHWHKMWLILTKIKCLQYRNLAIKLNECVKFSVKHSVIIISLKIQLVEIYLISYIAFDYIWIILLMLYIFVIVKLI